MRQTEVYKTKDIFESAWIYSQKAEFVRLEPNQKYSYFVFKDKSLCESLSIQYWSRQAVGNIKTYVDSLKTLKDLVFSQNDEGGRT